MVIPFIVDFIRSDKLLKQLSDALNAVLHLFQNI